MKLLLRHLLLIALAMQIGCSKDPIQDPPTPAIASHTTLFFLCGQGNLSGHFERNIANTLKAIGPNVPGNGRILVFRQTSAESAEIEELHYRPSQGGAVRKILKVYNEALATTDNTTVTRILKDMIALSPSNSYGLVLGSHATGWVPAEHISIKVSDVLSMDNYWEKSNKEAETRWFGANQGVTMEIKNLAKSLSDTGVTFEYLIFDACFMSSIEALYDLRHTARQIVASPTEIMLYGFPYDLVIPALFEKQGKQFNLKAVCEGFNQFYSTTNTTRQSGCIALTDCSKLEPLADVMCRIHADGQQPYNPDNFQSYEGLTPHLFYDLKDFVRGICSNQTLYQEFESRFDEAFPPSCRLHTPEFYTDYGGRGMLPITSYSGISVSEPSSKYVEANQQTAWYRETHE